MTDFEGDARDGGGQGGQPPSDVPTWEDGYIDRVSDRLMFNYDLEKDVTVDGLTFPLYGEMELHNQKHLFHPSLSFAHHELREHLFVRRVERARPAEVDRLVELGHDLAGEWVTPDEEHYSTEFTFVLVAPTVSDAVRERVAAVDERTLLKYGYYGHYDVHVAVVSPDTEALAASEGADIEVALRVWDPIERKEPGILGLIARRLQI